MAKNNSKMPWYSGNNRPIVLLDMDDVITDLLSSIIIECNKKFKQDLSVDDCTEWDLEKVYNVDKKNILKIFNAKNFFTKLEPKTHSINIIKKLIKSNKYDVYIITATCDTDGSELAQKIKWLNKYLPEFNTKRIIACSDKYIIRGDVIIDDRIQNLELCEPYMHCILMDSPTNKDCNKYIRIKSLKELPDILEKMFYNNEDGIRSFEKMHNKKLIHKTNKE